jgi:hypothetical protein
MPLGQRTLNSTSSVGVMSCAIGICAYRKVHTPDNQHHQLRGRGKGWIRWNRWLAATVEIRFVRRAIWQMRSAAGMPRMSTGFHAIDVTAPQRGTDQGDGRELRSNFGATPPKHRPKPDTIRNQKTKPGITIENPVRSAKPPSPVQIRAAPPKVSSNSMVCAPAAQTAAGDWTTVDYKP